MTFVAGQVARDTIDTMSDSRRLLLLEELGRQVGFLHSAGIVHGDLTTSNIIVPDDGKPFIIDFGMAARSSEPEDRGTDLHLLQRSLIATHALDATSSFKRVAKGYRESAGERTAESSLRKAAEIARRGRYFAIR
jgi:TP53 regulating kinase-like protein